MANYKQVREWGNIRKDTWKYRWKQVNSLLPEFRRTLFAAVIQRNKWIHNLPYNADLLRKFERRSDYLEEFIRTRLGDTVFNSKIKPIINFTVNRAINIVNNIALRNLNNTQPQIPQLPPDPPFHVMSTQPPTFLYNDDILQSSPEEEIVWAEDPF